jgi:hypothetical protein
LAVVTNANSQQWLALQNTSTGSSASGGLLFGNDANAAYGTLYLNSSTNSGFGQASGMVLGTYAATALAFITGATERARIDSTGNFIQGAGCRIYSIGTYNLTTAAAANLNVDGNGTFFRSTSALKYKKDIRNLENIDISLFRAVRYKSKSESDDQTKDHFGIIADEVDAAGIKELVNYGVEGDVEGFQYERLTVVLLKHCQEQQAIITALTARVEALEGTQP